MQRYVKMWIVIYMIMECVSFCYFSFMNFCRLSWMLVFFVVGSGSGVVRTCHGQHQGFRGE